MKKTAYILLGVVWTAVITSCSTTRRLADGDLLYTGVRKIEFVSASGEKVPGAVESVAKEPLNVKLNNPLYSPYVRTPLPVGLWVWNNLSSERETGLRAWLYRKLAKSPVLVSDLQPDQRMEWVEELLDNLGYFGSQAEYETLARRNPKKVRMNYRITVAEPWFYSQIAFPAVQGAVTAKIDSLKTSSLLRVGAQYNIDTLSAERQRIATALREESYYYFRPEYLEYLADTLQEPFRVDLRMVTASGIPEEALRPYRIGSLGIELTNPLGGEADSTGYNGIQIRYQRPLKLRPKVMARALTLRPGEPIRVSEIEETLTNLQKLGVFRFVNLSVTPLDSLRGGDAIDMQIAAAFDTPL
ncbi:MAG: hypothetical protein LBM20_05130, partial [Rikenellaceae bacterium]|nr:hypothetical protein [Rikenellaceae bacterium]